MKQNILGKTGLLVTNLGFGAAPIGYLAVEQQKIERILNLLLDRGINVIDTAASYPGSEEAIAEAVGHRRDQFVLVSKCGSAAQGLGGKGWSRPFILESVDQSLSRLKTDRLDVMLLHSCDLDVLQKGEALGALVEARQAGKVRFVGYSGDNEEAIFAAQQSDVAVLEMSINICDQANIDSALPLARENNVGVLAKRPIANAAWKPPSQQPGLYRGYAQPYADRFAAMGLNLESLGFSGDPSHLWPEIALRFTLSHPGVHAAIIGTTNPVNAEANIKAVEGGLLPETATQQIRAAFRAAQARAGKPWPGLT